MKYQQCKRCLMDTIECQDIRFDSNGNCNYCSDAIKRMKTEYLPTEEGRHILDDMISKIKMDCSEDKYDCLVGVSGGIDSSYILYLGYKYGLRMLAVHIDDGLDNPIAIDNLSKLSLTTGTKIINISPDRKEYSDILYSLLKASVANLAIAQDNLIIKSLQDYAEELNIKYIFDGSNFAHESILGRKNSINSCDKKYILGIQKRFGTIPIEHLEFMSLQERYIGRHSKNRPKHIRPLNYINYNVSNAIEELHSFCGFQYYGGKHYESILTRFMQCYYLPKKFNVDKRKSHFSSLIVSGQISREEAVEEMKKSLYVNNQMLHEDISFLANYMGIDLKEFERCVALPPVSDRKYKHSILNELAPFARKLRKFFE